MTWFSNRTFSSVFFLVSVLASKTFLCEETEANPVTPCFDAPTYDSENPNIFSNIFPNYIDPSILWNHIRRQETYETAKYPYDKIMEAISKYNIKSDEKTWGPELRMGLMNSLDASPNSREERVFHNLKIPTEGCVKEVKKMRPLVGYTTDGRKSYIVNVEGVVQELTLIVCKQDNTPCEEETKTPLGYVTSCEQLYEDHILLTFNEDNRPDYSLFNGTFHVPIACSCKRKRIPI